MFFVRVAVVMVFITAVETIRVIILNTIPLQHDPKLENRRRVRGGDENNTTLWAKVNLK